MGHGHSRKADLSPELEEKIVQFFNKLDTDHSRTLTKDEAINFWKSNYGKINANAMFAQVDFNGDDSITLDEWLNFWRQVKAEGYSEETIHEELDNILNGGSWVGFDVSHSKVKPVHKQATKNF
eukprot:GILJ01003532.1.p1 GENE.GILJ01003532.1~~GILJ01003532.1.p1  ORF type:complete len:124 (-),score=14.81 GILJ01003532.1:198-569(-)